MSNKQVLNDRVEKNLRVLKLLTSSDCSINEQQRKEILNSYSGWGGLREAIFTPNIYRQLKNILTDSEIDSIKASTSNAFYTPAIIVKFMWCILKQHFNFAGGDILEPSAGTGVFLDYIADCLNVTNIDAIELDLLTANILRLKHNKINIICGGFEKFYCGNKKYDLIISNPPYGRSKLIDESQKDLQHLYIHHYFIAKSARLLRTDGIMAMLIPSFVLDNNTQHARDIIASAGVNLILAYRLPDDLFNGAKVTVDIAFFRKCASYTPWQKTFYQKIDNNYLRLNEYYQTRAEHILGRLAAVPMYDRIGLTCQATRDLEESLNKALLKISSTT